MYINETTKMLIRMALAEDIGRGDCTTESVIDSHLHAQALIFVKQPARIAGLPIVEAVFSELHPEVNVHHLVEDGEELKSEKNAACRVEGPARALCMAERTALNFLGRLTGIATYTSLAVKHLEGTGTQLLDTRKTTPGWRLLEKYAVKMGGGQNHRYGLDDMVLIKDNHIAICGSITSAVQKVRARVGMSFKIEVEVDTLEQLKEALELDVDMILLDNMDTPTLRQAVQLTDGRVELEASGNMTIHRLAEVARTGVSYISMGALTHSASSVDVGMEIVFV
ncbi:carboxylating nicotinate-nucleotide diphosphorylase [Alicyclobacillus tolerans]|uniref:carboxylating nicotinate-nucleotide diphosphorylase n=1 Tax=Alicyclobacillus tolerans TaxID=90970 RepID=UPI003B7D3303